MCNFDGFNAVNDSARHEAGTPCSQTCAHAMHKALRGHCGVGGYEFLLPLQEAQAQEATETAFAERARSGSSR